MSYPTARALLVVALLVSGGCQGLTGSSGPPSDQRAVDALNRTQEAVPEVTSYRFTVDGQVEVTEDARSESYDLAGTGVVNVTRQRVNLTARLREETRMTYIDGYTLDTECSRMGWARHNLTESTRWLNYTTLGQQLALLDRTNVYWAGTEVVDGTETAVVTAHPTKQQLQSLPDVPTGNTGTGGGNLRNATVRVWIDTETGRIVRAQREIHVSGDGATAVATVTFHFSGYNEPTTVTRPPFETEGSRWKTGCPGA